MKPKIIIIIIFILTIAFFVAGIWVNASINSTSEHLTSILVSVEKEINSNNQKIALEGLKSFKSDWDNAKPMWTVLIDHIEIDNIEKSFVKTKAFLEASDNKSAFAECSELIQYIKHIPEKEAVKIKNIF